jgi:hypothetical protein
MPIPTYDRYNKPFDDEQMRYDYEENRYVLKLNYAMDYTGQGDLIAELSSDGTDSNAQWFMEQVSRVAYQYIRSFKDAKFQDRLTYWLSHSKSARNALRKLMLDMITYTQQEGGLFTAYVTGINLQEAKNITDISLKTSVGIVGHQIVLNHGLGEREFRFDFDIDLSKKGVDW